MARRLDAKSGRSATTTGARAIHRRIDYQGGEKKIWWTQPDGTPGLGDRKLVDMPLYGSHETDPDGGEALFVVEGEKARDALRGLGVNVLGTFGADHTPSFDVVSPLLRWETVYLWPDSDKGGLSHMRKLAELLVELGHDQVRIIGDLEAAWKDDAADWIERGGDRACLRDLCESAESADEFLDSQDDHTLDRGPVRSDAAAIYEAVDVTRLLAEETDDEALVDGLLYPGKLTEVGAYAGVGKTTMAMALAAALIKQEPAMNLLDVAPLTGKIVLFSELARSSLRDALDVLRSVYDIPEETIAEHVQPYHLGAIPAADPEARRAFIEKCAGAQLIIDTFDDWLNDNPNQTETVLAAWHTLREIANKTGATVLVFDHAGKTVIGYDEKMAAVAGSNAKLRIPDLVYSMKPDRSEDPHNRLIPVKERVKGVALELRLPAHGPLEAVELTQDGADQNAVANAKAFIRNVLRDGVTLSRKEIVDKGRHAGHSESSIKRALSDSKRVGDVHQPGHGQYTLGSRPGSNGFQHERLNTPRKDSETLSQRVGFGDSDGQSVGSTGDGPIEPSEVLGSSSAFVAHSSVSQRFAGLDAENEDIGSLAHGVGGDVRMERQMPEQGDRQYGTSRTSGSVRSTYHGDDALGACSSPTVDGEVVVAHARHLYETGQLDGLGPVNLSTGERVVDPKGSMNTWLIQSTVPGRSEAAALIRIRELLAALDLLDDSDGDRAA